MNGGGGDRSRDFCYCYCSAIPKDGRRQAYAEALAKARAEEEALEATEKAREAAEAAKKKPEKQELKKTSELEEAKEKVDAAARASVEGLLSRAKDFGSGLSWENFSTQLASSVQKLADEKPKVRVATVRGQAKAQSLQPKNKAVVKLPTFPKPPAFKPKEEPKPKGKQPAESKAEVRKVFGGLFKQETIYIDDDWGEINHFPPLFRYLLLDRLLFGVHLV